MYLFDIGGILDHNCLNFLFKTNSLQNIDEPFIPDVEIHYINFINSGDTFVPWHVKWNSRTN
jgi:hypothetical protein